MYPGMKASAFARFLDVARKGTPGPLDQIVPGPGGWPPPAGQLDAFRKQQLDHFEESVTYFRAVLGLQGNQYSPSRGAAS
jgi:hypothetical protein